MNGSRQGPVAAVLFDMDGLLIDTEPIWAAARERIAREHGGTWPADAQTQMMGMSTPEWTQWMHDALGVRLSPTEIRDAVLDLLERYYREEVPLMPGARDAVARMASRWPLAVASSSPRRLLELVLAETGPGSAHRRPRLLGGGRARQARARRLARGGAAAGRRPGSERRGRGLDRGDPRGARGRACGDRRPGSEVPPGARRAQPGRSEARLARAAVRRCRRARPGSGAHLTLSVIFIPEWMVQMSLYLPVFLNFFVKLTPRLEVVPEAKLPPGPEDLVTL